MFHDLLTRSAHLIELLTRSGQTIADLCVSRSSFDVKDTTVISA